MNSTELTYDHKRVMTKCRKVRADMEIVLSSYHGSEETTRILNESQIQLDLLFPKIPYIGGKENFFLNDFFDTIFILALYRVLEKKGYSARDVGKLMYEMRELQYSRLSRFSKWLTSKLMFISPVQRKSKKKIKLMDDHYYPESWKLEYVEGDGNSFNYGLNIHECGVHKFYRKHGGENLLPYLCMSDYAIYHPFNNIGFKRTKILGGGANLCDLRYKKGGNTPRGWPPEGRDEFQNPLNNLIPKEHPM